VTFPVAEREQCLGRVGAQQVIPSPWGRRVDRCWREVPAHFPCVALDERGIMPDHEHVMRNRVEPEAIRRYIRLNPARRRGG